MGCLKPPSCVLGNRVVASGAELSEMRKGFRLHGLGLGCGDWEAVRVAFLEHNGLQSFQSLILLQER